MSQLYRLIFLTIAVSIFGSVHAQIALPSWEEFKQVHERGSSVFRLHIENDSLLLNRDDGFFTSGIQLSQRVILNANQQSTSYGWRIGQDLYTASDIKIPPELLQPIDHPYAGWLYAGLTTESVNAEGRGSRFAIDVGCLGPCAGGRWAQTSLHRLLRQPLPVGWSSQLRQEWGVVVSEAWSPERWSPDSSVDVTSWLKGRLGNIFTDVSLETTLRWGRLNDLPEQAAHYVFLRAEGKAVGYNATIQGGLFRNQKDVTVHPRRIVGEFELGYQWRGDSFGFNASFVRRTSELKELNEKLGAQNFARLQFTLGI